jgi:hypothetical protein
MLVFIKQKLHNLISDQKFSEIFYRRVTGAACRLQR